MPSSGVVAVREYGSSPRRRPRSVSHGSGTRSPRYLDGLRLARDGHELAVVAGDHDAARREGGHAGDGGAAARRDGADSGQRLDRLVRLAQVPGPLRPRRPSSRTRSCSRRRPGWARGGLPEGERASTARAADRDSIRAEPSSRPAGSKPTATALEGVRATTKARPLAAAGGPGQSAPADAARVCVTPVARTSSVRRAPPWVTATRGSSSS